MLHECSMDEHVLLTIYILRSPFGEVMLNHDLQLHVECNFMYAIKVIYL